jgi:hypothetical protein
MWTQLDLLAAIKLISDSMDVECITATLNAQTTTLTEQPFTWGQARKIANNTGCWANVILTARQTPSALPPVSPADIAIYASIQASSYSDTDVIDPSINGTLFNESLAALLEAGIVTQDCVDQIIALATVTVPVWTRAVTETDVIAALSLSSLIGSI